MTTNKKKLSVAVVGAGNWGNNLIRNFFEINALKVICDKDKASLKQMQKLYPSCDFLPRLLIFFPAMIFPALLSPHRRKLIFYWPKKYCNPASMFLWKNLLLFLEKTPRN